MRNLFHLICFLLAAITSFSQIAPGQKEYRIIQAMPDDTVKVNKLLDYAQEILYSSPTESVAVLKSAISVSQKLGYDYGKAKAYGMRSTLYLYEMKLDSSKQLLDSAYLLVDGKKDLASEELKASLLLNKGSLNRQKQETDSAIQYYLQAAHVFSEIGTPEKAILPFYNISGIYRYLNDTGRALYYARQTRSIAVSSGDSIYLLRSLMVLGDAFALSGSFDSVLWAAHEGLEIETKLKAMPFAFGKFNDLLGQYHSHSTLKYDSAIYHFKIALDTITPFNIPFDQALVLQHLGEVYLKKADYASCIQYSKSASELARKLDMNNVLFYTLKNLSLAYEALGNYPESYKYLKAFLVVSDTLQNRNNRKLVMELEARYQTKEKERRLAEQVETIQKKTLTNYLLAGGLLAFGCISVLIFILVRNKQKLQHQRINELETEKQLAATEAVLKGEEQERSRLAKDLHDGLGGMLSGIKYSFQNVKENLIMTPDNQERFERGLDMLDSSIKEMRRVAHNMMPEALVKFGLDAALKDFCNDINKTGALKVIYLSNGLEDTTMEQTTAITIFRIVQELLNNTLRHASATSAIVQVSNNKGEIILTVEDDGKGFDNSAFNQSKGIGWNNIQSRVNFLKGKLDVRSEEGKGTSVLIEFNT